MTGAHIVPQFDNIPKGEIHITSDGLRIICRSIDDDGIPDTPESRFHFGLRCKRAFDLGWGFIGSMP